MFHCRESTLGQQRRWPFFTDFIPRSISMMASWTEWHCKEGKSASLLSFLRLNL